jgi:hypothetical protein
MPIVMSRETELSRFRASAVRSNSGAVVGRAITPSAGSRATYLDGRSGLAIVRVDVNQAHRRVMETPRLGSDPTSAAASGAAATNEKGRA